jgi:hypothetical protein
VNSRFSCCFFWSVPSNAGTCARCFSRLFLKRGTFRFKRINPRLAADALPRFSCLSRWLVLLCFFGNAVLPLRPSLENRLPYRPRRAAA